MELHDVGAVVWILRKCVWWVSDFSVERYRDKLRELDDLIRHRGPFVAHSTRHLIEAQSQNGMLGDDQPARRSQPAGGGAVPAAMPR